MNTERNTTRKACLIFCHLTSLYSGRYMRRYMCHSITLCIRRQKRPTTYLRWYTCNVCSPIVILKSRWFDDHPAYPSLVHNTHVKCKPCYIRSCVCTHVMQPTIEFACSYISSIYVRCKQLYQLQRQQSPNFIWCPYLSQMLKSCLKHLKRGEEVFLFSKQMMHFAIIHSCGLFFSHSVMSYIIYLPPTTS